MELGSTDYNVNHNCQRNTSREKKDLKTSKSKNWQNVVNLTERSLACFVSLTGNIFEMVPCHPSREAEDDLRRVKIRS